MFSNVTFETNDAPRLTGKTYHDENFPVGSFLLPKAVRPLIAAFYHFARAADDIADDPALDSFTKLTWLSKMDEALQGWPPALEQAEPAWYLYQVLRRGGFTLDQPRSLLVAFQCDAVNKDSQNWADLRDYCQVSANSVGRFLLEVHHETAPDALIASDALCTALQVLNHLQDCHKDFTALNRVYVPADLLATEGLDRTVLGRRRAPLGLLRIFDYILDEVERLIAMARPLPATIDCRGFRMEAAVIVDLAIRLTRRLRRQDLLARFHGLQRLDWILAVATGVAVGVQR